MFAFVFSSSPFFPPSQRSKRGEREKDGRESVDVSGGGGHDNTNGGKETKRKAKHTHTHGFADIIHKKKCQYLKKTWKMHETILTFF